MKPFVVCNPAAGGGRTGRELGDLTAALEAAVGPFEKAVTNRRGEASGLVRRALAAGPRLVVAVGGDGTISEVADGMFGPDGRMADGAALGIVPMGTGRDFPRSLGWSGDVREAIARIASGRLRNVDAGRLTSGPAGTRATRHFCNIASFGISGAVTAAVDRATITRRLGPKRLFLLKTATTLLTYRFQRVRIEIDGHFDETLDIALVAVANGAWFGSGMKVAPEADPADGQFDVIIIGGDTKPQLFAKLNSLYDGSHIGHRAVRVVRGRRVTATAPGVSPRPVLIEADGEPAGSLAAEFEILPGALLLRG